MTNTWDAANCLTQIVNTLAGTGRQSSIVNRYNGVGDRVGQTEGLTTTHFALDVQGLPEVIYTSEGDSYLHLPGVIMTESSTGEVRYLLSDGLGSIRQAVDDSGAVVGYNEYDPYGNPLSDSPFADSPFGFTGEWWEAEVELLQLRARWYLAKEGVFLSRDSVESEPGYQYVRGNVVNRTDASGMLAECQSNLCGSEKEWVEVKSDAVDGLFKLTTYLTLVESKHLYEEGGKGGLLVLNGKTYETKDYPNPSFPPSLPYRIVAEDFINPKIIRGERYKWGVLGQGSGFLDCKPGNPGCNLTDSYTGYISSNWDNNYIGGTLRQADCAGTANGDCAKAGETGAMRKSTVQDKLGITITKQTGWSPKSATICIEAWNAKKLVINDTGGGLAADQIDVYVGKETVAWEKGEVDGPSVERSKIYMFVGEK